MSRQVGFFGAVLALSLGAAWHRWTADEAAPREGVLLADGKKDELTRVRWDGPDLDVVFERRADSFGAYWWVTVEETRTKKVDGAESKETKVSRFKAGSAADKLVETLSPFMALRELKDVGSEKLDSFGLSAAETHMTVEHGGRTMTLTVGGETYGSRDVYVRDEASQRVFVIDDELLKPLKFAGTRLPERNLAAAAVETITSVTLTEGATTQAWTQEARVDRAAAYWKRSGGEKDEGFGIWMDKFLKLKSTGYVAEADVPAALPTRFSVTVRAEGAQDETVQVASAADAWYARSESTRGWVKLAQGAARDAADDVRDVLEGKAPEKPAASGAAAPPAVNPATTGVTEKAPTAERAPARADAKPPSEQARPARRKARKTRD
ncbi:MAG: hypothetical protein RLZZ299_149 [Pseudomonadota bacterium]